MLLMGFFNKIKSFWAKKPDYSNNHIIEDDERRLGAETRKIRAEIRRTKELIELERYRHELSEIQDELYGEEEDDEQINTTNPDMMFLQLLNKLSSFGGGQNPQNATPQHTTVAVSPPPSSHSDEQINAIIRSIPPNIYKQLQSMDEKQLKLTILNRYPDASPETLNRAVQIILHEA